MLIFVKKKLTCQLIIEKRKCYQLNYCDNYKLLLANYNYVINNLIS